MDLSEADVNEVFKEAGLEYTPDDYLRPSVKVPRPASNISAPEYPNLAGVAHSETLSREEAHFPPSQVVSPSTTHVTCYTRVT
jgi:hypothetical protein